MAAPHIVLEQCREVVSDMAKTAGSALRASLAAVWERTLELATSIREAEEKLTATRISCAG